MPNRSGSVPRNQVHLSPRTREQQPMTLKQLFNTQKYSERGVRYILGQFVEGGWCEIGGHEENSRFRLVVATPRLTDKLAEY